MTWRCKELANQVSNIITLSGVSVLEFSHFNLGLRDLRVDYFSLELIFLTKPINICSKVCCFLNLFFKKGIFELFVNAIRKIQWIE